MAERYHRAARDGYLDLLREATRKDCDKQDEDGLTPTLWAAYCGNLDALRLILSRGGNPDKADHLGNTALHHAASRGFMPCVSFLVNFGVNIWALDNDFHTALDVAGINEHMEIVSYLDSVVAKQATLNKKLVKKYKERSVLDAQKRIKEYNKRQLKSQKKAKLEDKKLNQIRDRLETVTITPRPPSSVSAKSSASEYDSGFSWTSKQAAQIRPYSEHFTSTSLKQNYNTHSTGLMRKIHKKKFENGSIADFRISEIQDGKKSMRSLTGLRRDAQILYVGEKASRGSLLGNKSSVSEPDLGFSNGDSGVVSYDDSGHLQQETASLFDRPGLGTLAFLRTPASGAMLSLPTEGEADNDKKLKVRQLNGKLHRAGSYSDSIGTLGSLAKRVKELPWDEDELESLDEAGTTNKQMALELFLGAHGLAEFLQILNREKIDLDALLLCNDDDLKDIGVPLGPRRKMLDAASKRKSAFTKPGVVCDSRL